ncbi:MAG: ACP S-malonyltransferase [Desulfovibrio sp.]|jgi:[acyl-carrier-protein] S-malonyltransferase|nr:ACP S-malonyltransferase [Desulfovibrio sp.]
MSRYALLFPGQGSQQAGMGRELAEFSKEAMEFWKLAERVSRLPLREIYWDGDEAAMSDTRALQPALAAVCLNLWREAAGRVSPLGAAGHSLGEFCALAAAGTLEAKTTLELTALRGRLMAEADPCGKGSMAALLKLDESAVAGIVAEVKALGDDMLLIANYNTPAQFVVSGSKTAVTRACSLARERGGRGMVLNVGGAFHSPMMAEASEEFAVALRKATWSRPRFPVYCNVTGRAARDGESLKENLLAQMTSPVLWTETIRSQFADGVRRWLELGPKALLGKMVLPCLGDSVSPESVRCDFADDAEKLHGLFRDVPQNGQADDKT